MVALSQAKEPEQGDHFLDSSAYSWRTTNRNPADNAVVTARIPAMASNPKINEPVESLIKPIMKGPKKPPSEPIVVMKASPPAAPRPVRKLVGTVQKIARAEVTRKRCGGDLLRGERSL